MMLSKVKPLHKKVEDTSQCIDSAEHKMSILENKRKVPADATVQCTLYQLMLQCNAH